MYSDWAEGGLNNAEEKWDWRVGERGKALIEEMPPFDLSYRQFFMMIKCLSILILLQDNPLFKISALVNAFKVQYAWFIERSCVHQLDFPKSRAEILYELTPQWG